MAKPSPAALRLCHAVGLATRVRVGRWCSVDTALSHLSPADRENEDAVLETGVSSGLVEVNLGPVAHSIKLTEAGLAACHKAGVLKSTCGKSNGS